MNGKDRLAGLLAERTGKRPAENTPLSGHSTFRIGGPADLYFEAVTADELRAAVSLSRGLAVPFFVLGGGSNVLFDDLGFRGLVIRNAAEKVDAEEGRLVVSSGARLGFLLGRSLRLGIGGLEFMAGIPGTVGGAICGNAGAFGRSVADVLRSVRILGTGEEPGEIEAAGPDLGFRYRHSRLKSSREVIIEAVFEAVPGDRSGSEVLVSSFLEKRKSKHPPWGTACAGSYFKNPLSADGQRVAAGRLLEEAGARGMSSGGAAVFEGHCNFLINRGGATARDVLDLADRLKKRVLENCGVSLEEEVIYVRPDASWP